MSRYKDLNDNIEEIHNIEDALDKLSSFLNVFDKSNDVIEKARGKLFTFASYRLGVKTSGTNIDLLCVAPKYVKREDFFSKFVEILKEDRDTEEVKPLPEAFVPFIILKYKRKEFNVLFASLDYDNIDSDFDILDEKILRNIDEKTIRSINGCRSTEIILKLIKNPTEYRIALKILKEWLKKRGLNSKKMGYLGDSNLAIMMCYVYELYPNASSFVLLKNFFDIFRKYDYKQPIQIVDNKKTNSIIDQFVFDPDVNMKDREFKMAILTPAYPSLNSTPNVNEYSLKVIVSEFERGYNIVDEIERGISKWDKLIEEPDFFNLYNDYLYVTVSASNDENLDNWSRYCESRYRRVVTSLGESGLYENIHLYPVSYKNQKNSNKHLIYFIGLKAKGSEDRIKISSNKLNKLSNNFHYYHKSDDMKVKVKYHEAKDLVLHLSLNVDGLPLKRKSSNQFSRYKMRRF